VKCSSFKHEFLMWVSYVCVDFLRGRKPVPVFVVVYGSCFKGEFCSCFVAFHWYS
jgi:hypothetical protein